MTVHSLTPVRPDLDAELATYVAAAFWTCAGEDDYPLENTHDEDDLHPDARMLMRGAVGDFLRHADPRALAYWLEELGEGQIGHDFWLTRNGHGAGFWDRFVSEPGASYGRHLTEKAKAYGTSDLYVGDDGRVHVS